MGGPERKGGRKQASSLLKVWGLSRQSLEEGGGSPPGPASAPNALPYPNPIPNRISNRQ